MISCNCSFLIGSHLSHDFGHAVTMVICFVILHSLGVTDFLDLYHNKLIWKDRDANFLIGTLLYVLLHLRKFRLACNHPRFSI